jgi:hypothetical protein
MIMRAIYTAILLLAVVAAGYGAETMLDYFKGRQPATVPHGATDKIPILQGNGAAVRMISPADLNTGGVDSAAFSLYSANRQAEINNRVTVPRYNGYSAATQAKLNAKSDTGHGHAATEISYTNPTYTTVGAALDQLLYVAPGSPSVTGGGTYETGQTITSVVLNWTITLGNKPLTSQSIDNGIGSISTALRTYTHSGQSITSNRTYTVSITDGTTPRTGTTTVSFSRRRHWGATTTPLASMTSADILALASNEFSTSHSKTGVVYDCTGGKYPTYAFVATAGTLTATTVGGLAFSDYSYRTISHTNASGNTTNYYLYQFNSLQTGSAINVNWD